ncbi:MULTISPECIES: rod shape-determining protein RodA [Nitrosomonas]|uniref:Peptidoglycan glycosyltransferase MrdB n=2 Tax=Nitrosomonas eutropha TaxID=916 RepID=A0ABX5MBV6_9PROT|nr:MULTISPECIES: rod shape-determining protein RodA [Nitrosomonas]ABI59832.1 cell elongation-specific peptidoglycan biosynthesis regulator RodA [Nitrosomonas eutropha C91]MXS80331.1 rod shape-determining protein RodA [Nitrosomonas sp. GH22]PXV83577.1 cell elongation-specific peptidoglycan biosynthesis regulator RodA [Nitrosomonas eutropha]SDW30376.1 cell elongation-specific peptidoglycan biosynthesis regulator RodA [Nitrosomonas eutropha]SEI59303.1 cell elongation-specific peptidoglycan biosyn
MITPDIKQAWHYCTRYIDNFLLAGIFLLMLTGLIVLYSATGGSSARVISQLINMVVAYVVMWVVANIPPQRIMRMAFPLYVLGIVLLIAVALFGEVQNGARRWLNLGIVHIQPSELLKIAVPLMMAWYFDKAHITLRWRDYVIAALILLLPVALIVRQPDLGTALLILISGFYVIFLAGLSWRLMTGLAVAVTVSLPLLWSFGMHDYQRKRIMTMLDPSQDALGAGYHTIQSSIAIGSGGIAGKGWLKGTQSQLDFLPEPSTDFIFSVFSEEFGLIGNSLLLSLYLIVIGRCMVITASAPTRFARLVAGSITLTFFTYVFVNMGMVSGILPVVGIPLPLISYGGTSMVTILLGFGILMSIHTHPKLVKT